MYEASNNFTESWQNSMEITDLVKFFCKYVFAAISGVYVMYALLLSHDQVMVLFD